MKHYDLQRDQLVEEGHIDAFVSGLKKLFREHQLVLRFDPELGRPVIEAWQAGAGDYLDDAVLGPGAAPSFLPERSKRRTQEAWILVQKGKIFALEAALQAGIYSEEEIRQEAEGIARSIDLATLPEDLRIRLTTLRAAGLRRPS